MSASSGDSHPWPIFGARFRLVLPIFDADGDVVVGAASLDTEISQDQGTFADATNEATEIATSSGLYYIDLISTELDTKSTAVIVKTGTAGAKTSVAILYPKRLPVIRTGTAQAGAGSTITLDSGASAVDDFYNGCYVNCTNNSPANVQGQARRITDYVGSTRVATVEAAWGTNPSSATTFEILAPGDTVNVTQWAGTQVLSPNTAGEVVARTNSSATGSITSATFAASAIDAAAIAANAITDAKVASDVTIASVTGSVGSVTGAVGSIGSGGITTASFAAGAINAAAIGADAITDAKVASDVTIASVTGAVGSVTGAVGSVTGSVGSIATGGITTASFAAGAINAAAIAADAITDAKVAADVTIASVTGAVGSVTGAVGSVTAGVTVTTNNDKTGYGLSSAAVQAIWDALTSALTTVGSVGKLLVDNINATISSRLASASYTTPPTVGQIADQVWEETLADHSGTSGSTAAALNAAGSAGDPWNTALPGAYGAGTAGKIIGDNINATISSRATPAQVATELATYDGPTNAEMVARTLAAADYATAAALATVDTVADAILVDTAEIGAAGAGLTALASAANLATVDTVVDAILVDTNAMDTRLPSDPADASIVAAATGAILSVVGTPAGISLSADVAAVKAQTAAIEVDTQDLQTQVGVDGAGLTALGDTRIANLDATVSSRATPAQVNAEADQALLDVGLTTTITGRMDAAVSTRATPAEVNAEVVDALNVDTYAEPTGAPPATTTIVRKIGQVYKHLRNEVTQTATTQTLKNDGGTSDVTATVSDDGTTFTRGKFS